MPLRGMAGQFGLALVGSAAAALLAYLVLGLVIHDALLQAGIATVGGVGVTGWLLQSTVVAPLVQSSVLLQGRYEAAVADALLDPLTGLGNHRAFQEELDRQVEHAQRYGVPVALMMLDVDEFKAINDEGGHAEGDRALTEFGRLVRASVRRVDRAFRVGGDEFAILLPHTDADGAYIVGRRLLAAALGPSLPEQGHRPISFSAGISSLPGLADTRAQLLTQADAALYATKRAGRTDVLAFDPAQSWVEPTSGSGAAIAEVIARGQLRPVYQPIVELGNFMVLGYEGLIRPVAPAPFADAAALFETAAASGHLVALDLSCLDMLVAGAHELDPALFLSVNLSPRTVESAEFSPPILLSILARHGFAPSRLVLELTEREAAADPDRLRERLEACRRAGIRLAADDLGAGNAGLRLLSELRFDIVKVDLSLVQRTEPGAPASAVVGSVVALASRTGAMVVGEGVEQPEQVAQLVELGVRAGQGFFFGRPAALPAAHTMRSAEPSERGVAAAAPPMSAWRQSIGLPTLASGGG
jgi:diguanylate cyclase (GGDEF)-like protein